MPLRETVSQARNTCKLTPHKRPAWLAAVGLVALVFAAYLPVARNGFIWDDDDYVYDNPALTSAEGLRKIWFEPGATPQYYPLVFTVFWLANKAWGFAPFGYHVINVILHAASAVILWRLLTRLGLAGAWFAAAIFAVHPVHVESVAWITELKNVLSGVFYLAAALAYFKFARVEAVGIGRVRLNCHSRGRLCSIKTDQYQAVEPDGRQGVRETPGRAGWYIATLLLYVCALLSKTITCTLPGAILLVVWWKRGSIRGRDILHTAPMFLLGGAAGWMTAHLERLHVGAAGPEFALSFVDRCLIAGRAAWFYLGKIVWPQNLVFIYPRWKIDSSSLAQLAYPSAAIILVAVLWLARRKLGKAPLITCLFFGGTLLPALGFVNVYPMRYSFVADHFQYLAAIGPIALAAALLAHFHNRQRTTPGARNVLRGLGALALCLLGVLTWRQCGAYADEETLWQATLKKNPDAWIAWNNLGYFHAQRGQIDEGIAELEKAVDLNPYFAEGQSNLGSFLLQRGRLPEAAAHLSEAVRLDPRLSEARGNLGASLLQMGRQGDAIDQFREALRLKSDNFTARFNLGCTLMYAGEYREAVEHLEAARRLDPSDADVQAKYREALDLLSRSH